MVAAAEWEESWKPEGWGGIQNIKSARVLSSNHSLSIQIQRRILPTPGVPGRMASETPLLPSARLRRPPR